MAGIHAQLAAVALGVTAAAAIGAEWHARDEPMEARFWFDGTTFALPRHAWSIGDRDVTEIERVARSEIAAAFAGLRITFDGGTRAAFQVRVVQDFPVRVGPQRLAAAESIALGPLGSHGWVSFRATAALALRHAAAGADRRTVIEAIGRGIGRVAAHEFAHQILTGVDLHATSDRESYEYASADRPEQFEGPMRWSFAAPLLAERVR